MTAFVKAHGYRDGLTRQCKACRAANKKAWRARGGLKQEAATPAAKERQLRYLRNRSSDHPQRVKAVERVQKWNEENAGPALRAKQAQWSRQYKARQAAAGPEPTDEQKAALVAEYSGCCAYCKEGKAECLDHVVPLTAGGMNELTNRVPSCLRCNGIKKNRPLLIFLVAAKSRQGFMRGGAVGSSLGS